MKDPLEKIKKLLRLHRDGAASPAESAQALVRAMKLARESGIDLNAIDPDEDSQSNSTTHCTYECRAVGDAEKLASALVRAFFSVKIIYAYTGDKREVHLVGSKAQCEVARYAYEYIVKSMRKAWKLNTDRRLKRSGFLQGYYYALYEQMPETFKNTDIVPTYDTYIQETFYKGKDVVSKTMSAVSKAKGKASVVAGLLAGQKAGIRNGIGVKNKQIESC